MRHPENPANSELISGAMLDVVLERLLHFAVYTRQLPALLRYAITTGIVLIAFGLRWWIFGTQPGFAFVMSYPAVVLTGLLFDFGAGFYAVALGAAFGVYFFVPPVGKLAIMRARDSAGLLVFLGTAGLIAVLLEAVHGTFRRMTTVQGKLEELNARLAQAQQETESLLRENIHRFGNDLQRLSAMVSLQASRTSDIGAKAALAQVQDRIDALVSIKTRLDIALVPGNEVTTIESRTFLSGLVEDWAALVRMKPVSINADIEAHPLPASNAVLLGLVLNELMTNAEKYAFPDDRPGIIRVAFHRLEYDYVLRVEDDGVGYDPDTAPHGTGLGQRITRGLAGQLGGRLNIEPRQGGGTVCTLVMPTSSMRLAPAEVRSQ